MSDPWQGAESDNTESHSAGIKYFEDNFELENSSAETSSNSNDHKPLPDSASYLQGLERKLEKIKKGSKLVEALAEKREDCLRALLNEETDGTQNNNLLVSLDTPVDNADSAVQELYRHLQPVQPITIGETVHIVKYDQLEEQREATENIEEDTDTPDKLGMEESHNYTDACHHGVSYHGHKTTNRNQYTIGTGAAELDDMDETEEAEDDELEVGEEDEIDEEYTTDGATDDEENSFFYFQVESNRGSDENQNTVNRTAGRAILAI